MSNPPTNITDPEHWAEWFEKCALDLCGMEAKEKLGEFAYQRYLKLLPRALSERRRSRNNLPTDAQDLIGSGNSKAPESIPGNCWRDAEASCWYDSKGRKNKENPDFIPAGAKTHKKFCREVASAISSPEESRNYLEGYCSKYLILTRCRKIVSQSICRAGGPITDSGKTGEEAILETIRELPRGGNVRFSPKTRHEFPDRPPPPEPPLPASEADEIANQIIECMTSEEKILILAKAHNKALTDPVISARLDGRKSSTLYVRQKASIGRIHSRLRQEQLELGDVKHVLRRLHAILDKWKLSPECGIGECFMPDDT